MEMDESNAELSWDLCRIFNKGIYYSMRQHLIPNKDRKQFSHLTSEDICTLFSNFYSPWHLKPKENPFIVLKVLRVHKLQNIKERSVRGLKIDAKILKTADTRNISSAERNRALRATGSLAEILHGCLEVADILVIAKDYRAVEKYAGRNCNLSLDPWSTLKNNFKIQLNSPYRENTQIFLYRHDGKFNYRSWMTSMEEIVAKLGKRITVGRFDSSEHGASMAITPIAYKNRIRDIMDDSLTFDLNDLDSQNSSRTPAKTDLNQLFHTQAWYSASQDLGQNYRQVYPLLEPNQSDQGQTNASVVPESPPRKRLKITYETQALDFDSELDVDLT